MIFPDEKTYRAEAESWSFKRFPVNTVHAGDFSQDVNFSRRLSHKEAFTVGAQWAIKRIKSAASEGFEEYAKTGTSVPLEHQCYVSFDEHRDTWQAAVISTAAKYEEKLREKDAEIDFAKKQVDLISQAANRVSEKTCQTKAENEQLKAVLRELHEAYNHVNQPIEFLNVLKVLHKHTDLITKINKGE